MAKLIIYGLLRTGTNYLEYLMLNYVEVEYDNSIRNNPYFGMTEISQWRSVVPEQLHADLTAKLTSYLELLKY